MFNFPHTQYMRKPVGRFSTMGEHAPLPTKQPLIGISPSVHDAIPSTMTQRGRGSGGLRPGAVSRQARQGDSWAAADERLPFGRRPACGLAAGLPGPGPGPDAPPPGDAGRRSTWTSRADPRGREPAGLACSGHVLCECQGPGRAGSLPGSASGRSLKHSQLKSNRRGAQVGS